MYIFNKTTSQIKKIVVKYLSRKTYYKTILLNDILKRVIYWCEDNKLV